MELKLQVGESENTVSVPFLVARENLELPLAGFNVIEHLIKTNKLNSGTISHRSVAWMYLVAQPSSN